MSPSIRIVPTIFIALWLNIGSALAEYDDVFLECTYGGLKSLYKTPKLFKITRDGFVYDGPNKMELNHEGIVDSYLFGSTIKNNKMLMHNIDIFNGHWRQYIITKDEIFQIRNDEEITKNKINSYAALDWERVGECKSIDKKI